MIGFNDIVNGIVLYAILWFVVLFVVLPFGVRTAEEAGETLEVGHASSAPVKPRIKLKILITSLLSAVLWGVVFFSLKHDLFGLSAYIRGTAP